jgi:uncharacterized alkaline shock family protein YloU
MSRDDVIVEGQLGRIELSSAALASLAVRAAESVPGVRVRRPRRGLDISVDGARATVELGVVGPLDGVLPDVGERVQRAIADALRSSASLETSVSVLFEELE